MLGDIAGLGVTLGAVGSVIGMTKDAMTPMMNLGASVAAPAASGWDCSCGAKNIQSKFCPECGEKKPEPVTIDTWDCPNCGRMGITAKFCGECGFRKPESAAWDCPNCGRKKPEEAAGWTCPDCGQTGIKSNFCPNCGAKKPALTWNCPDCGQTGIKTNFCPNCGHKKG